MLKYSVKSYVCTNFTGLMDSITTDSWDEVEDFIWENVQKGYDCEIIDNETGDKKWSYAEDFDEEALNPEDLIRDHKKSSNSFYADLRMEQQEQM